ncbi:MAG: UDP-N-acetylglucosamine 2-epimerase (non-hydrolyzing) [Asgard group archaeon]|nr:UDP-N-acetylglucosamine 2-epimerase (non-hydrolyzing) [Asgard group archaeon]
MIFIGTRPEITKMAPIIRKAADYDFETILVHSGQHYDLQMSNVFLEELELPKVDHNLEIGSGTHGYQTGQMLEKYEQVIEKYKPKIVLALGDTNTVVAASLVCAKINIPFGHVEAGIRSFDLTMPEEINRVLADSVSGIYFAPTEQSILNLYYQGLDPKRIFLTGNTAVDATIEHSEIAKKKSAIIEKLAIPKEKPLITLTAHRAENVDNKERLESLCKALVELNEFTIVFSVHPRTKERLEKFDLEKILTKEKHIILSEPFGYLDFLKLMQESVLILTDSGGLQEEALTLKKPCVTLRTNTERPETIKLGVNFLVGTDKKKIIKTVRKVAESKEILDKLQKTKNPFGDGKASVKILEILKEQLKTNDLFFKPPEFFEKGSLDYRLIKIEKETTVKQIEEQYKGKVTLVYDDKGQPQLISDKIPKNWFVRIQY